MKHRFLQIVTLLVISLTAMQTSSSVESTVPDCHLKSMRDIQQYHLQHFRGKVVYMDFWASWCSVCVQSFPFINQLNQELKHEGLQVFGINMDEKLADADKFLAKYPVDFSIVRDIDQECAKSLSVRALPSAYLIDRNGVIRYEHIGFKKGEAENFVAVVKQLLAETARNP